MIGRVLLLASLAAGPALASEARAPARSAPVVHFDRGNCREGLNMLGDGPFGLLVSCEGALGDYLTVAYVSPMSQPKRGGWSIEDRCWHEEAWSSDMTSYAWDGAAQVLILATSQVYGSGSVYALDLIAKKSRLLAAPGANEEEISFIIESLDPSARRVRVRKTKGSIGNTVKMMEVKY